jgi:CBS domain containing-hemolysin-like protein
VQTNSILDILKQFRSNNQVAAVVLDKTGQAVGILTLDAIIDEIFGREDIWLSLAHPIAPVRQIVVDRTFPSDTPLAEISMLYQIELASGAAGDLEELFEEILGYKPSKGDAIRIGQVELTVEEAPLIGPKMIAIHTVT